VLPTEKHDSASYDILNREERDRATRFYRDVDRERFVTGRLMLRDILARYLAVRAETIELDYGPYGKPILRAPVQHAVFFNLSHAGAWVTCAFVARGAIGIDLESMESNVDIGDLAKQVFSPGEYENFLQCAAPERRRRFFETWSSKEAYIKAIGKGLSYPMAHVEIVYDNDLPSHVAAAPAWTVRRIGIAYDYTCAIVYEGSVASIDFYEWMH
jgi:4'-phosphopantetheinyl transferase